jgi:hypothetical protein
MEEELKATLQDELSFHRNWKRYCMLAYGSTTVGTLLMTTASTILAAMKLAAPAALCAGCATVLLGIEKSLLFREKWRLHLDVSTRLQVLSLQFESGLLDASKAVHALNSIRSTYSAELPIEHRES